MSCWEDFPTFEAAARALGFEPIDSAPRDGRAIEVVADGFGPFLMSWNQFGSNQIAQPGERGIWWGRDGGFTWSEADDCGPTHWRPTQ